MQKEGTEAVKETKKFLESKKCPVCGRGHADLVISSVPKSTLKIFRELANSDEFKCVSNNSGHYGFLLKTLVDNFVNRPIDGLDEANAKIDILADRVAEIQPNQPEEKKITMCDGNTLRPGG